MPRDSVAFIALTMSSMFSSIPPGVFMSMITAAVVEDVNVEREPERNWSDPASIASCRLSITTDFPVDAVEWEDRTSSIETATSTMARVVSIFRIYS
jgi:hypothetical protein